MELIGGRLVKKCLTVLVAASLLSRARALSYSGDFLQIDAQIEEGWLVHHEVLSREEDGMPASPCGGLMPDDRHEGIVQGRAQAGDRGLLLDRSTDRMSAAR
jgi:hypothetical protein